MPEKTKSPVTHFIYEFAKIAFPPLRAWSMWLEEKHRSNNEKDADIIGKFNIDNWEKNAKQRRIWTAIAAGLMVAVTLLAVLIATGIIKIPTAILAPLAIPFYGIMLAATLHTGFQTNHHKGLKLILIALVVLGSIGLGIAIFTAPAMPAFLTSLRFGAEIFPLVALTGIFLEWGAKKIMPNPIIQNTAHIDLQDDSQNKLLLGTKTYSNPDEIYEAHPQSDAQGFDRNGTLNLPDEDPDEEGEHESP